MLAPFVVAKRRARILLDRCGRNRSYRFRPLGRVLLNMRHELVEAMSPFCNKISVIEFFINNDVHQGQRQGAVRSGTYGQIHFSFICKGNLSRVNDNYPGPFLMFSSMARARGKSDAAGLWPQRRYRFESISSTGYFPNVICLARILIL